MICPSSNPSILIAGCGYTGKKIAAFFLNQKFEVYGIVRHPESARELKHLGIHPLCLDIRNRESLGVIPKTRFAIFCPSPGKNQSYSDVYETGIKNLLETLKSIGHRPELILYLSSTGVWGDKNGKWVDETETLYGNSEKSKILVRSEKQILNSGFPAIVFRLGGIYGPGRNRIQSVSENQPIEKSFDSFINLIHVEDIARATAYLIEKGEKQTVYLGVDEEPVKQSEYYSWIYNQLNRAFPNPFDSSLVQGKRCSNKRLKSLGFQFQFPTFREGYTSMLKNYSTVNS